MLKILKNMFIIAHRKSQSNTDSLFANALTLSILNTLADLISAAKSKITVGSRDLQWVMEDEDLPFY